MAKTADSGGESGKGPGIMGLIVMGNFVLVLLAAIVLFLAAIDFGFMDLRHALMMPAGGALVVLVLCAGLGGFASMKTSAGLEGRVRDDAGALSEGLMARMKAVEDKFSGYLGEETDKIRKENEAMKAELEAIRKAEEDRVKLEFEDLKRRNLELQEQLQNTSRALGSADPVQLSQGEQGEAA